MNAWILLIIGIAFETAGTACLKLSDGFSQWIPSVACIGFFSIALFCVAQSVKTLDLGVAYAVWCGAGITFITLISIVFFNEVLTAKKLLFIALITVGVLGLHFTDKATDDNGYSSQQ